jgi:SSS family solute:Na+ symporter
MGLMGLVMAAYFSAILSTADSCLMAASGSFVADLLKLKGEKNILRFSQLTTLGLGVVSIILASVFTNVLTIMLYSYSFMVSGLLIPLLAALFFNKRHPIAAVASMIIGGSVTIGLSLQSAITMPFNLDHNIGGILASLLVFAGVSLVDRSNQA